MKISRLCLLAASLAAVLTVTGCDDKKTATPAAQASAAKTYNIGVVQLVEHQALDAANKGFVDGLASKGFVEGKNVKFDFQNAQADQSNLRNIATRFTGNKVDLIGAIATPAAQTMANATNKRSRSDKRAGKTGSCIYVWHIYRHYHCVYYDRSCYRNDGKLRGYQPSNRQAF